MFYIEDISVYFVLKNAKSGRIDKGDFVFLHVGGFFPWFLVTDVFQVWGKCWNGRRIPLLAGTLSGEVSSVCCYFLYICPF